MISSVEPTIVRSRQAEAVEDASWNRVLARYGRSFWLASRFLSATLRREIAVLYTFCRRLDDIADEAADGRNKSALLQEWRAWIASEGRTTAPETTLGDAVLPLIARYPARRTYILDLIDGLLEDCRPRVLSTRAELFRYCYQVGGTIGLILAPALGVRCPRGEHAARDLGIAMQLTNIVRDVGEDARRGRVYLPQEDLERFALDATEVLRIGIACAPPPQPLRDVVRLQIYRAQQRYSTARHGYRCLAPDVRLTVIAAAELYASILTVVRRHEYDTIRLRAVAGYDDKLAALLRAWREARQVKRQEAMPCPHCG
jgi:phytoene synthase